MNQNYGSLLLVQGAQVLRPEPRLAVISVPRADLFVWRVHSERRSIWNPHCGSSQDIAATDNDESRDCCASRSFRRWVRHSVAYRAMFWNVSWWSFTLQWLRFQIGLFLFHVWLIQLLHGRCLYSRPFFPFSAIHKVSSTQNGCKTWWWIWLEIRSWWKGGKSWIL